MIPSDQPNAFATGRNPKHSAVAVTQGITKLLSEDELRGVISHELAHIKNRDILTQSVASAIGAMITYLAYFALWFGGDDDSPLGLIGSLALVLLAPIAATLIQLAVSRQREYAADATGAQVCGNPESLASALLRLEEGAKAMPMQVNQATEPLYIVKPFSGERDRRPVLDPSADRGARPAPAPDASRNRLARSARRQRTSPAPDEAPILERISLLGSRRHLGVRGSPAHPGGDDEPVPRRRAGAARRRQRLERATASRRPRPGRARAA